MERGKSPGPNGIELGPSGIDAAALPLAPPFLLVLGSQLALVFSLTTESQNQKILKRPNLQKRFHGRFELRSQFHGLLIFGANFLVCQLTNFFSLKITICSID